MRVTLLLLILAGSALLAAAGPAQGAPPPWSVDETLSILDATHAQREWRVQYDAGVYSPKWILASPPDASFVSAHAPDGAALVASEANGKVTVTSDGPVFFVDFKEKLEPSGAFLIVKGGPSASSDSPTSVHVTLPPGWSMPGWAGSEGLPAPLNGTWSSTGPFYVEALLLPPGTSDAGPDARGKAHGVVRDADAQLFADRAFLNVTILYDTSDYSPSWSLPLPTDATLITVTAPLPNTTFRVEGGVTTIQSPYPTGHHLGVRAFTLHYAIATSKFGGGYARANLSVPGTTGDDVAFHVKLADGLTFVGGRLDGALVRQQESYHASGPSTLSIVFLPPTPSGAVRFTQGPFLVQAPAALEAQARLAAQAAEAELPTAASFAAEHASDAPIHVIYTADNVFGWEEGLYHGLDATSIRASDLETASGTPNLTATRTLVHEATHDLVDRQRGGVPFEDSFLNEGLSRLAEVHVEMKHPNDVLKCETSGTTQRCSRESARVDAKALRAFLQSGKSFDVGWNATTANDAERGFDYDYSGFVLLHYERSAPAGAIGRVLAALANTTLPPQDAVLAAMQKQAPSLTRDDILYPGKADAAALDDAAFAAKMGDLVAPSFPTTPGIGIGGVRVPGISLVAVALCVAAVALLARRR